MTSGNFHSVDINSIVVERTERQRRELRNIDDLALSIQRLGLIHPVVITEDNVLVAGERRLTACRQLGWTAISVQYTNELTWYEQQMIELDENLKRENLTWQEEVAALARFHQLKTENEEDWSQAATAEELGVDPSQVARKLAVAQEMHNPAVAEADRFSTASNIVSRNAERKRTSVLASVSTDLTAALPKISVNAEVAAILDKAEQAAADKAPLLNASFHDWQETYNGPKFNLIHCDFPYGINVADTPRMSSAIKDHYEDSPDIFWSLLARLGRAMDNVVAEQAHLIFWHSMKFHADAKMELERMGWEVNPFPLIWFKSDNAGIAPNPQTDPRQVYEVAFFARRGGAVLTQVGTQANCFAHPGKRNDGAIHVSEKPVPMLRHFMRMICDEYSSVLDPTCGSGNALKVAEALGASSILGIEQSVDFYETACLNWSQQNA